MDKNTTHFFINVVGMPKRVVFMLRVAKAFPKLDNRLLGLALREASIYLEKYYYKVGADEYEKTLAKLRHPAYKKRGTRKNVI